MVGGQQYKSMAKKINNWINGIEKEPSTKRWIEKINPHNGEVDSLFADSKK